MNLTLEQLMARLLAATPGERARVAAVFTGAATAPAAPADRRLFTISDAARELGISRATVHRCLADGRLPAIEVRAGRRRISSAALSAFAAGRGAMA